MSEPLIWNIRHDQISRELAEFVIQIIEQFILKDSLGLLANRRYRTFSDDIQYHISIEKGYILVTNASNTSGDYICSGPLHLIRDKLENMEFQK